MIWNANGLVVALVVLGLFLLAAEAGFRLGRRRHEPADERTKGHLGSLQGALLGLLALMLGFTFAMAMGRFDARKSLVLDEANAIGTTALRARLLPEAQRGEILPLLRSYVDARLAFYDVGIDPVRLEETYSTAARLQEQLWQVAVRLAQEDPRSVPAGLFVSSLNETIDLSEKRRQALDNHVPEPVLVVVIGLAAVALGFVGHACGLDGPRRFASTALVSLLIALVILVILDLDRPRRGVIRVSQASMIRLKHSLAGE